MDIHLNPVAFVKNDRINVSDDHWGKVNSQIILADDIPSESLLGIELFSHLEIFYYFDKVDEIVFAGHPRGNKGWPYTGIFAQRKKDRPNKIGCTIVEFVSMGERHIIVKGLDAINGTPVIDIKPVFKEFLPRTAIVQPSWCEELMKDYWK